MGVLKVRKINNRQEQQKDLMDPSNLVIKWQMKFHIDKVMQTLNLKKKNLDFTLKKMCS